MLPDMIYAYAMIAATLNYTIMCLFPGSTINQFLQRTRFVPLSIGVIHAIATLYLLTQAKLTVFSWEQARTMYNYEYFMLVSWIHIAAFDLLISQWIFADSKKRKFNHWVIVPFIAVTSVLGPAGLLSYLAFREIKQSA